MIVTHKQGGRYFIKVNLGIESSLLRKYTDNYYRLIKKDAANHTWLDSK